MMRGIVKPEQNKSNIVRTTVRMDADLHSKLTDRVHELGRGLPPRKRPSMDGVIQQAVEQLLADADESPLPKSVTIFRPQGTVSACDDPYTEVKSALSGPSMPAKTEPENIDPEVTSWLAMLQYILTYGEYETKKAITSNLERFHLLTQILTPEVKSHERGGEVPKPPTDQQARMDRVRELRKRYTRSGADPINDEDTPRSDVPPDSRGIGKRRKH